MKPTKLRRSFLSPDKVFVSALVCVLFCASIGIGAAHADSKTIILIAGPRERIEIDRLQDTIHAHMSDLNAEVAVRAVVDLPADPDTQLDVARALLQEASGLAAVWIEYDTDTLKVLVKDKNAEQILERPVPATLTNGDQIYDAVAAMVRAALTPWFAPEESATADPKSVPELTSPPAASPKPIDRPRPKRQSGRAVQATFNAAYTLVANLDGPVANGGLLGAGIFLFQRLSLGLDLRILQATDMSVPDRDVRLFRLPLRFKAALSVDTGPVALGLEAGVTLDFARVLGVDAAAAPDPIHRMRAGFTPGGFIRYFATDWLSIDLLFAVDIFYEPYYYQWNAAVVFTNGKIQPSGTLGLSFFLPRTRKELRR